MVFMMVRVPTLVMVSVLPPMPLRMTGGRFALVQFPTSVSRSGWASDTDAPESTLRIASVVAALLSLSRRATFMIASDMADGNLTPNCVLLKFCSSADMPRSCMIRATSMCRNMGLRAPICLRHGCGNQLWFSSTSSSTSSSESGSSLPVSSSCRVVASSSFMMADPMLKLS